MATDRSHMSKGVINRPLGDLNENKDLNDLEEIDLGADISE